MFAMSDVVMLVTLPLLQQYNNNNNNKYYYYYYCCCCRKFSFCLSGVFSSEMPIFVRIFVPEKYTMQYP